MTDKMIFKDGDWMLNGEKYSPCDNDDCRLYMEGTIEIICLSCVHCNHDVLDFYDNSMTVLKL